MGQLDQWAYVEAGDYFTGGVALGLALIGLFSACYMKVGRPAQARRRWLYIVLGSLCMCLSITCFLGRSGVVIDRVNGTVTSWWGLCVPMWRQRYQVREFDRVTISHRASRRGIRVRTATTVYPLHLDGAARVMVAEPASQSNAQRLAKEIGELLQLPIEDASDSNGDQS